LAVGLDGRKRRLIKPPRSVSKAASALARSRHAVLDWWDTLDDSYHLFAFALLFSVVLHAFVLSLRFQMPENTRRNTLAPLEVVIVNSKTRSRPEKADVLAQASIDGGGDTDQRRRARTPLPNHAQTKAGTDVRDAQRRVRELEAQQRELLAQTRPAPIQAPAQTTPAPAEPTKREPTGAELRDSAMAMIRTLEAQVSKQIDEYNRRPKKTFVGARAQEFRFAQYVEDWRLKVERNGNLNYPESARGRVYGSLRLSVSINADGSLAALELERSSGHPVLDRAAERIVQMSAPFARFPNDIRRDTDILVITRTWHFAPGDRVFSD
jgi:protein TonB